MRPDTGKCLHYYFYFMDAELGLIYLRVPTWCPFRLQFYCNGHRWLARQLAAAGIGFTPADNAFLHIDDWQRAQTLADRLSPVKLAESRLGWSRVGRLNGRDEDASRPDLRRPSLPR